MSDIVDRLERLVILDEVGSNNPLGREAAAEITRLRAEVERVTKDGDEAYELGKRDGYEEAVQDIDVDTGGDGEYRFCTDGDPDRHCPTAAAMKAKIAARFEAAETALSTLRDRVRNGAEAIASKIADECAAAIMGNDHLSHLLDEQQADEVHGAVQIEISRRVRTALTTLYQETTDGK